MPWTTRIKRHGGMRFIEEKRKRQMTLLAQEKNQDDEILKGCLVFLTENPNRVLGPEVEAYFKWPKLT